MTVWPLNTAVPCLPSGCASFGQNVPPFSTVIGVPDPSAALSVMTSVPASTTVWPVNAVVAAESVASPAPRFTTFVIEAASGVA